MVKEAELKLSLVQYAALKNNEINPFNNEFRHIDIIHVIKWSIYG